ncbi:MAG: efflux transporter outer membrane subunit [Pseudomonadota bacterium]
MNKPRSSFRVTAALTLAGSLMLSGCMVGPDYAAPELDVPSAWSKASSEASADTLENLSQWWVKFDDPVLDELIAQAMANNPDRDIALARVREARARLRSSQADLLPQASVDGTGTTNQVATFLGQVIEFDQYDTGFDASWEIDIFGKTRRSIESSKASIEASQADYVDVMTSLVAEVARTYVDIRSFEARLVVARDSITVQEQSLALVRARTAAGFVSGLDFEQAKANLESTRAQIPALERDRQQAINRLATLLGKAPQAFSLSERSAGQIPAAPRTLALGIPAEALRQRGDVRSAERNLAAQNARIGVAKASLYPSFSLFGSIGTAADDPSGLFGSNTQTSLLGGSLTAPVLDAGRLQANVRAEEAIYDRVLATYQKTVLDALREVEDALISHEAAIERVANLEAALKASSRASRFAQREYEVGTKGFDRFLDAERSRLSFADQLVLNEAAEAQALIALFKSLGGGRSAASLASSDPEQGDET